MFDFVASFINAFEGYENKLISFGIGTGFEQYQDIFTNLSLNATYDDLRTNSSASNSLKNQAGEYSELIRQWPQYGDFLQTLVRWAAKPDVPSGLSLRYKKQGSTLSINFHYDGRWADKFSREMPSLHLKSSLAEEVKTLKWRRLLPGVFSNRIDLSSGETINGVIRAGEHAIPFGPLSSDRDSEWRFDLNKIAQLRTLSQMSGGREINDLSEVWKSQPARRLRDISPYFLTLALLLFLVEIYQCRVGPLLKVRKAQDDDSYSALIGDLNYAAEPQAKPKGSE